jgi:hypothetical protein
MCRASAFRSLSVSDATPFHRAAPAQGASIRRNNLFVATDASPGFRDPEMHLLSLEHFQ